MRCSGHGLVAVPRKTACGGSRCHLSFTDRSTASSANSEELMASVNLKSLIASIEFGAARTRTGHLLCALVSDEDLARQARDISPEFAKLTPDTLRKDFPTLAEHSSESAGEAPAAAPAGEGATPTGGASKT